MPECVKVYTEKKSIKAAVEVQDEIIETYQLDFNKYNPKTNISCLKTVFSGLAGKVGQQIKYSTFSNDYSTPTLKKAFESLLMARIATKVNAVSSPGLPIDYYASDKKFKSVFLDIGLMNRVMGFTYDEAFRHENLISIYKGQLAEQFVGQEFISYQRKPLHYWSRAAKNSNAEIDFLVNRKNEFIPVEVKDGPAGKLRSMHLYLESYETQTAVVFNSGNMGEIKDQNLKFLPLYYAYSFIKNGID
jgi:predicted AAA+ superfamily ATPase